MAVNINLTNATDNSFKPTLYDVNKVLDESVVGEYESRMALFTNWILSEKNVMMAGPRSSGKTFITDHIISFVGQFEKDDGGQCYILTSGSEKSAWYEADNMQNAKYVVVLELNKITQSAKEILKDWGEGKDSEYKTTVHLGGIRRTNTIKLKRKPFVFCLADEDELKIDAQLASRLTIIRTDNSITQNKAVMKHQAVISRQPDNPVHVDEEKKKQLSNHIKTLPDINTYEWKNPAAEMFTECIPPFFTDCRRDFPKYLANIAGICRFYWKDRLVGKINNKEVYFITPQDMYLNHVIYGKALISSALKCNNIEREIMTLLQASKYPLIKKEIQKQLKKKGIPLSLNMISRHLNGLCDLGYIDKDVTVENKKILQYEIGQIFQDFAFEIDWQEVIEYTKNTMKELYPKYAEEYIKKYCDKPIVTHPFTGEKINLLDIKKELVTTKLGQLNFDDDKDNDTQKKSNILSLDEMDGLNIEEESIF